MSNHLLETPKLGFGLMRLPVMKDDPDTPFTRILEARKRVKAVVYGHLHGDAFAAGFSGECRGIRYYPVSCDGIGFRPAEIPWP